MEAIIGSVVGLVVLLLFIKYKLHQYRKRHPHTQGKSIWEEEKDALDQLFKRGTNDV